MYYFNEGLGPLKHFLPDGYIASSIADFLESKDNIPAPLTWKVIDFLLKGKPRTSVMVDFQNVQLRSVEALSIKCGWTISDGLSELLLFPLYPNPREMTKYRNGNYSRVRAFYVPKYDRLHLVRASGLQTALRDSEGTNLENRLAAQAIPISKAIH